jgi:hypothetical protein
VAVHDSPECGHQQLNQPVHNSLGDRWHGLSIERTSTRSGWARMTMHRKTLYKICDVGNIDLENIMVDGPETSSDAIGGNLAKIAVM